MKAIQLAHLAFTVLLLTGVMIFVVLLLVGVIEVRRPSDGATPEPRRRTEVDGVKARLLVIRGVHSNWEYSIYDGQNIIGRADEKPVDIDLQPQEPAERVWSSRQHAVITCEVGALMIEDLRTANGTYVNGARVPPGKKQPLRNGDIIQIGEVQMKVLK